MQLQLPSATLNFSAQAETGADHTINKLRLSHEWRVQSKGMQNANFSKKLTHSPADVEKHAGQETPLHYSH